MHPKVFKNEKAGPEKIIQNKIIKKLRYLDWSVRATHGNLYQFGFPDLYCAHAVYGQRWVEVKDPTRRRGVFTESQLQYFSELRSKRIGVWVLTSDTDEEIAKLHKEHNWWHYLDILR